jgi:hypothetical protein
MNKHEMINDVLISCFDIEDAHTMRKICENDEAFSEVANK